MNLWKETDTKQIKKRVKNYTGANRRFDAYGRKNLNDAKIIHKGKTKTRHFKLNTKENFHQINYESITARPMTNDL